MMNKIYSIKDSFAALVVMVLNQSIEVTVGLHRLEERGFEQQTDSYQRFFCATL